MTTCESVHLKPAVAQAIEQLKAQFPNATVDVRPDGQGGAYVVIDPIDLGDRYTEATRHTWIGFHLPFALPFADIYPHHVRRDLARSDGQALGAGMSHSQFEGFGRESIQLSRRSNRRDAALEMPVHKLLKVIKWASLG